MYTHVYLFLRLKLEENSKEVRGKEDDHGQREEKDQQTGSLYNGLWKKTKEMLVNFKSHILTIYPTYLTIYLGKDLIHNWQIIMENMKIVVIKTF